MVAAAVQPRPAAQCARLPAASSRGHRPAAAADQPRGPSGDARSNIRTGTTTGGGSTGQRLRVFTLVDAYTRECVALDAAGHFSGRDVAQILTRVASTRRLPATIQRDNGTDFTPGALDQWAYTHRVALDFSRPGKPTDNATIESFNASVRRECLSEHYFSTLADAQSVLRRYRDEYNNHRPHSSLGQQSPAQFRAGMETNADPGQRSERVA